MTEHLAAYVVAIPFFGALLVTVFWLLEKRLVFATSLLACGLSFAAAIMLFRQVFLLGEIEYRMGGWVPPVGIVYRIDYLNGVILVLITLVSLLNLAGSRTLAEKEFAEKTGVFYALYLLFVTGLLGITATGDAFNLYVLLEIASLTGYALIGLGRGRAPLAGLYYLFLGTVGASFYLLGVGFLYLMTGSLNMQDISVLLPGTLPSSVVVVAFTLCLTGLFVKMALFPVHSWLPNAYSYSPSTVSCLVAPLTTKVMIYVMVRLALTFFSFDYSFEHVGFSRLIIWVAVAAIVMSSLMALAQTRLRKMLACIVIAEVGYMVGGFWLGNRAGMSGAILHIINDALMTLCVFMAAGAIAYRLEDDRICSMKGVFRTMPVCMAAMVVGGLSLIGVPPTCGFFSKWFLISGGIAAGNYGFVAALVFSSLVNVILFFRLFEVGYFESPVNGLQDAGKGRRQRHEPPVDLLVPLVATALLLVVIGLMSGTIVHRVVIPVLPASFG